MLTLIYDHSFAGFLSAVFELYAKYNYGKCENQDVAIVKWGVCNTDLFAQPIEVAADNVKAERVLAKLEKLLTKGGVHKLICAFLSETESMESCLLGVIRYAIQHPQRNVLHDYTHPHVMQLANLVKSVSRERHRMLAFVRFEKMRNGIFFARIEPDFNVLPLIVRHFRQRYQDQQWAIFDLRRGYGIYYDLSVIQLITDIDLSVFEAPDSVIADDENAYQKMWQGYFSSVNITERKNTKLHIQQLPRRYWKYLTEKQIS